MESFTQQVIRLIQGIPPGKVMTYGQIASCAGNPRSARQVARALHTMTAKYSLPWHRVINGEGRISIQNDGHRQLQKELLESEGVEIIGGKIDLVKFRFDPGQDANER